MEETEDPGRYAPGQGGATHRLMTAGKEGLEAAFTEAVWRKTERKEDIGGLVASGDRGLGQGFGVAGTRPAENGRCAGSRPTWA